MRKLLIFVLAIFLAGCALPTGGIPGSGTPTATQVAAVPTSIAQPTATAISAPTAVPVQNTPVPAAAIDWSKIPVPASPADLVTVLDGSIQYVAPPTDCATANDPNQTCSTRKGQATDADFTMKAGQALRMSGDKIVVTENGNYLTGYQAGEKRTLVLLVNNSKQDLNLHMTAKYGSFRGYFAGGPFTVDQVVNLRDLAIFQYIVAANPLPTPAPVNPTPVWNCESSSACHQASVYVLIWDGFKWTAIRGLYNEDSPTYWTQQ